MNPMQGRKGTEALAVFLTRTGGNHTHWGEINVKKSLYTMSSQPKLR